MTGVKARDRALIYRVWIVEKNSCWIGSNRLVSLKMPSAQNKTKMIRTWGRFSIIKEYNIWTTVFTTIQEEKSFHWMYYFDSAIHFIELFCSKAYCNLRILNALKASLDVLRIASSNILAGMLPVAKELVTRHL